MLFDPAAYGEEVMKILALDGGGYRLMPLVAGRCSSEEAREALRRVRARQLFPGARAPEAALAGLWLYFSCLEEAHSIAQQLHTPEGSFWHGILHRQEPDAMNAAYWFRRTGRHAIFPSLLEAATAAAGRYPETGVSFGDSWDPFGFIELCEEARREAGSALEKLALEVQRAEWQLLFDYCARPGR